MFVHSGMGRVYQVVGGQPGSRNDIQIAKTSDLYQNPRKYLRPGHVVLGDLAFYHVGHPFLCRIAHQNSYSIMENQYNKDHSYSRVISENFYQRLKCYFPIFNLWTFKLESLDIHLRAFTITTNIIITIQSPLRR